MARKTDIRLRRSNVLNSVPGSANLSDGELAMNTNTGALYFKKSDNTIITAVDNTIFHIDSDASNSGANKKIGIGTTSPEGLMHFAASSDYDIVFDNTSQEKFRLRHGTSGLYLTGPDTNTLAFGVDQNHDVRMFSTSGSAYATFDGSTSRVGIGTTSPDVKLHLEDASRVDIKFEKTGSETHYIRKDGDYLRFRGHDDSTVLFELQNNTNGSNVSAFPNGKVGIGTTSPAYKLDVVGKIKSSDRVLSNVYQSISTYGMAWKNSAGSDNMFLSSDGKLGIGTTSPEEDLHVAGDIKLTGTLFNGTRDEYSNSNLIRLNQRYTGGAVSGTSYFEQNEYQKVVTITPNGSSENYQVSGTYYVQSGGSIQEVHFVAGLRSGVLPDLTWSIYYEQSNNGTAYIEPFLWTKETTTAGFILGFKVLTGSIFGSVTADINIIPRNADDKDNVSINTTVQSEQTTIDTGFTNQSFTLRKSVINANTGLGANPGSYRLDVAGNTRVSGSVSLVSTLQSYSGAFNVKNIAQDQDLNLQVNDGGTNTTGLKVQGSTARVGIGASSPDSKLHIQSPNATGAILNLETTHSGGIPIYNMKGAHSAQLRYQDENGNNQSRIDFLDGGDFNFIDATDGTSHMKISSDGYVGIGDTTPSAKLHVSGDGRIAIFGDNSFDDKYIEFREGGTTGFRLGLRTNYVDTSGDILLTCGDDKGFGIVTNTTTAWSSVATSAANFYITEAGLVGIGTTAPSGTLHVKNTGNGEINIERASGALINLQAQASAAYIGTNTNHVFGLKANGSVRLKIATSGAITFNDAFTFPTSIGNAGQILKVPSTGSTLVWADDAGGGSATVVTDTDGDTKIQVEESADEDVIRFDVAGSEVAFINSTTFDIAGRLDAARDIRLRGSDSTPNAGVVRLFTDSSNTFHIDTGNNGSNQFSMDPSGNIDVNGTITAVAGDAGTSAYSITSDGGDLVLKAGADDVVLRTGGSGTEAIYFQDGAQNTKMFINAENNRVGINTTSPTYSLHVNGDSNILLKLESTGTDQNARMIFSPSDGDKDWNLGANDDGQFSLYDAQNSRTPFAIAMGAASNSLTISSTGNVAMSQNLTVTGNLTVNGTTTTINTATLDVEDKNITLNYSSGDSSGSADGAGITIQDAVDGSTDATLTWNATDDMFMFSHGLRMDNASHLLLERGGELRSLDTGGNIRTIARVDSSNRLQYGWSGSGGVLFMGGGSYTERMRIHTNGNIGIGTTTPGSKLTVEGDIRQTTGDLLYQGGGNWDIKHLADNQNILFYTSQSGSATEKMRIRADGRVGIGTNAPAGKLHISGNSDLGDEDCMLIIDDVDGTAASRIPAIMFRSNTGGTVTNQGRIRGTGHSGMVLSGSSALGNDLVVQSTGVGIGTNSPSYKLDVTGTGRFTGAVTMDSTLTFSNNTAATMLNMSNNSITGVNAIQMADPGPNEGVSWSNIKIYESPDDLTTNSAGNFQVVYGSTRRLTVNNTGIDVNGTITGATNISKQVARTATGATDTENGPNTWAKLATYSVSGNHNDGTFIYGVVTEEQSTPTAGTIIVRVRWGDLSGSINPNVKVEWASKNSGNTLGTDAFKLIGDGVSDDIELWVQKDVNYGCVELWELAYRKESNNAVSVSYENNSAWQSSTPTGTAVNETSGTLTFDSKEVILGDNFANDTNVTLEGASSPALTLKDTTNNVTFKSYAQDSNAFTGTTSSHNLLIGTNNTEAIRINNSQRVGIGTSSPAGTLHVVGTNAVIDTADGSGLTINRPGNSAHLHLFPAYSSVPTIMGDGTGGLHLGYNSNTDGIRINTSNYVGIGDSSPSAKLHVVGSVLNNSIQDYGIVAFENSNLEGLSIGYDADNNFTYLYSREVGVASRGLHLNGSIFVDNYGGTVGIGTTTPNSTCSLEIYKNGADSVLRIHDDAGTHAARVHLRSGGNDARIQLPNTSNGLEFRTEGNLSSGTAALTLQTNGRADFGYAVRIEEYQIDTTETSTSATSETVIHSFAAATFRSARYTVQVTNSTDSAYHTTELLLVHNGTTANITEFGTIFTGTAAEATFDADINSGNVRLKATPASGDSMEFKVIAHSVTV